MKKLLLTLFLLFIPSLVLAQGRAFDGTGDNLKSADNAVAGLDVDQKSWGVWILKTVANADALIYGITADGGSPVTQIASANPSSSGVRYDIAQSFSTTNGRWRTNDQTLSVRHHLAITYDRSATTNDPVMYIDGVSVTVNEAATPVGTTVTGEDTLKMGEDQAGTGDLDGTLAYVAIQAGSLWSAAQVNRAMWWGRPGGGLLVYHPLVTTKLVDEGSAAETLTATNTTVAAFTTPVVRPGSAMLGMGVGW